MDLIFQALPRGFVLELVLFFAIKLIYAHLKVHMVSVRNFYVVELGLCPDAF